MSNQVHFIHISDTHFGPDPKFELHGVNPYECFINISNALKNLPFDPDFIVHTGDITSYPTEEGYRLFQKTIETLGIPIYYATGNHDDSGMIKQQLAMGKKTDLGNDTLNTYSFEVKENKFITVDARGPDEIDPHGQISSTQMEIFEKELASSDLPVSIFIHFPAITLDSVWVDREMLILEGEKFHKILVSHARKIRGVFFGHVHRGMQVARDGILYSSVGSTCLQFQSITKQENPWFESTGMGSFNLVTVTPDKLIVKEHEAKNGAEKFLIEEK